MRPQTSRLMQARTALAGKGTKQIKLLLNRLAKTNNTAKALRIALEIEDASSMAKKYDGGRKAREWREYYYEKKSDCIDKLISLFLETGWLYGKHFSDIPGVNTILYFHIPNCEQISFHTWFDEDYLKTIPDYEGKWDEKANSTLDKLETAILSLLNNCSL